MKTLLPDLQKDYYEFQSVWKPHSKTNFQKKVKDEYWIKYFITCSVYEDEWQDRFIFDAQFCKDERAINIETVAWTNDPEEKWRPYPTIQEIEEMFEKMWVAYWSEHYEKFDLWE